MQGGAVVAARELESRRPSSGHHAAEERGDKVKREKISHEKATAQKDKDDAPQLTHKQRPTQPPVLLHPRNGFIAAGASCTIEVRVQAPVPGWQTYAIVVRNLKRAANNAGAQKDHTLQIRYV